tara:strand:+ start:325 stop:582 length:258 start_codon:yes stop_codon:yes gene_type:complete
METRNDLEYANSQLNENEIMERERMHNFLTDDLGKLKINVEILIDLCNNYLGNTLKAELEIMKENPIDKIDDFFSYWEQHINKLK